jgi:Zn-dependent protease with chaperone function
MPAETNVPGPIDRVSFVTEQQRRRRATWRLLAASVLASGFIGVVASTVISPLVLAFGGLTLRALHYFLPSWTGIEAGRRALLAWVRARFADLTFAVDGLDRVHSLGDAWAVLPRLLGFAAFLLPGIAAMLLAYVTLSLALRRSVGAAMLLALKARAPHAGDFAEHRLVNIVEEIAIAGGVAAPQVMLIDAAAANAASLALRDGRPLVLATRGLIDRLDRDEVQGVIAHLIGSLGNGDQRLTVALMAVFETLGLFLTILDLPFRAAARRTLWRLTLLAFRRRHHDEEAAAIADQLAQGIDTSAADDIDRFLGTSKGSRLRRILTFPLLPLALLNLLLRMVLWLWVSLLLGMLMSALWRGRRYLADATAVQLTRNPDGLARALQKLAHVGGLPHGGEAADYLFIAAPQRTQKSGFGEPRGVVLPLQPPLDRRLQRLVRLGAAPLNERSRRALSLKAKAGLFGCLGLVFVPLLAALFGAVGTLTLMVVMLGNLFGAALLALALR